MNEQEHKGAEDYKTRKWLNMPMFQSFESLGIHYYAGEILSVESGRPVDFRYSDVSPSLLHLIKKNREEVIGKTRSQVFGVTENDLMEKLSNVAKTGESSHFESFEEKTKSFFDIYAWRLADGQVACLTKDITEFKKSEKVRRESEDNYRHIVKFAPTGIYEIDFSNGRIVSVNDAFCQYSGYSEQEWLSGKIKPSTLLDEDSNRRFAERIKKVLAGIGVPENVEYRGFTRHGKEFWTELKVKIIIKEGKPHGLVIAHDITDRKKAEIKLDEYKNDLEHLVEERTKKLKDSERLAVIGATAGMVGHDIRNPLQAISGDVYLLKDFLSSMPDIPMKRDVTESLNSIENNVEYINKIVQDLQDFTRSLAPQKVTVKLEDVCREALYKKAIPENVIASCVVHQEVKEFCTDASFLKRILANLVNNAVQAMPKGGKLSIHARKASNHVLITVEDTGVGVPDEVKSKLFTPMFTTKSKGQGFGLVVVKRMTEALGGTVSFESEEGKGTKFKIELPIDQ